MSAPREASSFWAITCAAGAIVFGAALWLLVASDVVTCRSELRRVPEPAGWRQWPALSGLGGYRVHGTRVSCVGHGIQCGLTDTELRDDSLCPRGGVSLDAWFNGSIYQSESDLTLRASDETFVASGHDRMGSRAPTPENETLLVAFQRRDGPPRLAFEHRSILAVSLLLAATLLQLVVAAVRAARLLLRARRYRDETRYQPGRRDDSEMIVFDDGTPPLRSAGSPGPVIVRTVATTGGSYRTAPRATAGEIVEGDLDTACQRARARAASTLRQAGIVSVIAGGALVICAIGAFLMEALSSIN